MAGAAVTWASSAAAVATVSNSGLVTAVANGTATITATAGSASGSAAVTVAQEASAVAVTPAADTVVAGDTLRLAAEATDANGHPVAGAEVDWESGDTAIAVVDVSGLVTGVAVGEVEITATSSGAAGRAAITVADPAPTTIVVTPDTVALTALGQTAQLAAEVRDQAGRVMAGVAVTWSSADTLVATVDSAGLVTAAGGGATWVTATAGETSGEAAVTVMQSAGSVVVSPAADTIAPGDTLRLVAEAFDENGHAVEGAEFAWSSSSVSVAMVDGSGLVRGIAEGTATITATAGDARGTAQITVTNLDRAALVALYNATDGPNWVNNENWLTDAPLREWYGVSTDASRRVVRVDLAGSWDGEARVYVPHGLSGRIPAELGSLANLTWLNLGNNALTGRIPAELGSLANLTGLDLWGNQLTGPIPQSFLQLDRLFGFQVGRNESLCVPGSSAFVAWLRGIEDRDDDSETVFCNAADVAALQSLFEATGGTAWTESAGWLGNGAVEEWYGITADSLGRVTELDLTRNGLAGQLSSSLGDLVQMTVLRIGSNALTGGLPQSLARVSLQEFRYAETQLCTPAEEAFRTWLSGISSHEGTGVECAPLSDRDILEILYKATDGPNWTNNDNWLTDAPLEAWYGVSVDHEGSVVKLALIRNNLTGRIPPELGNLSRLMSLSVSYNQLSGPIPPELGNLSRLSVGWFQDNNLSGPIPAELGNLSLVTELRFHENALSGSIPPELGNLSSLPVLEFERNNLSGPIPPELGNLSSLLELRLQHNNLSGPIPPELGNLPSVTSLRLDYNALNGPLPPRLGDLATLEVFELSNNNVTGSVPSEFGRMASLRQLSVTNNAGMSGPLPAGLTDLAELEALLAGRTSLCAPTDADFQVWRVGVYQRRIAPCTEGSAPMAYLTQAIQSRKFPVPLVAGERALLRVFPTAGRATSTGIPAVAARFFVNGRETHVENIPGKADRIPTEVDEGSLAKSANAEIPEDVIRPGLEMVIEVDPDGALDPALGVAKRIPENGRLAVEVRELPLFDLTLIPFIWSQNPDSSIVDLIREMAADPENHPMLQPTRTLLPVGDLDVTAHEPVLTSMAVGYQILNQTEAIRVMEGGSGHYMGMLAAYSGRGGSGVAMNPGRSTFSLPRPGTMAHELGHNMKLGHAPCGGPGGVDPSFPYPDGSVGTRGYDFRDGGRLVRPSTPDLMSYCGPGWISDYYFTNALRYRLFDEGAPTAVAVAAKSRSLLLWGGIGTDSVPFLDPAFVVDAPAALPDSAGEFRLTGRTDSGADLFSLSFGMPEVADGDGSSGFAFVLPVQSAWEGDLASISLTGPGGSVTLDGNTDLPMAILRNPRTRQIRGIISNPPLETQAAADAGAALAPGLEVLLSRGIPDTAAWRR